MRYYNTITDSYTSTSDSRRSISIFDYYTTSSSTTSFTRQYISRYLEDIFIHEYYPLIQPGYYTQISTRYIQPRQEQPRQEQPRQEQPRQEQPRQEQPRQEQPRQEPQPSRPTPDEIKAQELARALLLEHLDQDNKKRFIDHEPIEIDSKLFSDIKYQIPISKLDRICALKNGQIVSKLCLIVKETERIPLEDVVLTKLLHILYDEEYALKTANHSSVVENLLAGLNQI